MQPEVASALQAKWQPIVGSDFEVVVAQLSKFREGGGLGISLEGTVDVENGEEVRPHHYIRSVLSDGPVGRNGNLQSGDELLEVRITSVLLCIRGRVERQPIIWCMEGRGGEARGGGILNLVFPHLCII